MQNISRENAPVVFKFGGGVLKGLELDILMMVVRVIESLTDGRIPFVVLSALKGVTTRLEKVYELASSRGLAGHKDWGVLLQAIFSYHEKVLRNLFLELDLKENGRNKTRLLDIELRAREKILKLHQGAIVSLKEMLCSNEGAHHFDSREAIKAKMQAIGEPLSVIIVEAGLQVLGYKSEYFMAQNYMMAHGMISTRCGVVRQRSAIMLSVMYEASIQDFQDAREAGLKPIVLTEGFIAMNESGETVTLGREGSDRSAVEVVEMLRLYGAEPEVFLVKDVDVSREIPSTQDELLRAEMQTDVSPFAAGTALEAASTLGILIKFVDIKDGKVYPCYPMSKVPA